MANTFWTSPATSTLAAPVISVRILLSLSAGALVDVGATHLLTRAKLVALAGGVLVAVIIVVPKA